MVINGPFSEAPWLYLGFLPPSSGHTEESGNSLESVQGQKVTLHIPEFKTTKDELTLIVWRMNIYELWQI